MVYQELYKKYRPKQWADFIGQEATVSALQSALQLSLIPTGFLFAGTHGCGKTSAAFMLAKALNCDNTTEDGNPCNECDTCKAIDKGTQIGVNYISMSNKGSADAARDLIDKSQFRQPVKKQIWILDECHSLSRAGQDAFLIPLESENQNSLFIFCSTDPEKITPALKSRLTLRNFSPVKIDTIAEHLANIVKAEDISLTAEQVAEAAMSSNGSVRDAIQNLETIAMHGELETSYVIKCIRAMLSKKYTALLLLTEDIAQNAQNFNKLAEHIYRELADYLVFSAGGKDIDVSSERYKLATEFSPPYILKALDIIGDSIHTMSFNSVDNRVLFEIACNKVITFLRAQKEKK